MMEKYLITGAVYLLGLGGPCLGEVARDDIGALGALRVHANQIYDSLHIPNTNSVIECRPLTVDLHQTAAILNDAVCLTQRSAFTLDCVPQYVGMHYPDSVPVNQMWVVSRSDVLPEGGNAWVSPPKFGVLLQNKQDSTSLDCFVVRNPSLNPVNIGLLSVACQSDVRPIPGTGFAVQVVAFRDQSGASLSPVGLSNSVPLCCDPQRVDRMIVDNYLTAANDGGDGKWDSGASRDLLNYIVKYPLTQEGYDIYALLVAHTPGNTEKRRLSNLNALATEAFGERASPVMSYYTACHLYRALDYEGAISYIDRCENQFPANPERIRILRALCLTQLNRTGEAIALLKKLQTDFPNSPLMPDIMFMEGWMWFQDGKNDQARSIMDVIVAKYGTTGVAVQARQVLDELNVPR